MTKRNYCLSSLWSLKQVFNVLTVSLLALIFSSCVTTKNTSYFQTITRDTTLPGPSAGNPELKIKETDILAIHISSLSNTEDVFFNSAATSTIPGTPVGYFVNANGKITMHKLGEVSVVGMTRGELRAKLQKDLLPYLKDPVVTIQFINHKVTIFGEVDAPKIINMPEERISLIEVLVSSGDLTENAKTDNIKIIREEGNQKIVKHINLQDHSIFNSPWYYVQPNDMVFVSPDMDKKLKEEKKINLQRNITLITAAATFVILIVDRVTR